MREEPGARTESSTGLSDLMSRIPRAIAGCLQDAVGGVMAVPDGANLRCCAPRYGVLYARSDVAHTDRAQQLLIVASATHNFASEQTDLTVSGWMDGSSSNHLESSPFIPGWSVQVEGYRAMPTVADQPLR